MKKVKVVVIGAGSASFGRGIIADLLSSEELRETELTISLVDINEASLDIMFRFAQLLKDYYSSPAKIEATVDRRKALPGAKYVITAVARRRQELWEKDFFLPYSFGFKHILGECGGPGAAFHTLRSLHLMIPIAKDIEQICKDALLLNYTNPESRVCMGVSKLTEVKVVGLCHGAFGTLRKVAQILGKSEEEVDITIGGINHFHWVLYIKDKASGEDLYPQFHQKMAQPDFVLEPLTKIMYEVFGIFPFPADSHIGEYVPFAYEVCGPLWFGLKEKIFIEEEKARYGITLTPAERLRRIVDAEELLTDEVAAASGELAIPIICDIEFDRSRRELSVNIPNTGYAISNLPEDAIVEVPAVVDAKGLHPVNVGALPEPIAELCRRQITIQKLLVEAYKERSKKLLLQALSIDPLVDSIDRARKLIDEMLHIQLDFLPEFK